MNDLTEIYAYGMMPRFWRRMMESLKDNKTRPNKKEVQVCKEWIRKYCKPKKATKNGRAFSSYFLKHRVEATNGLTCYVSNGAFIQAAVDLGYEFVRDDPFSINVYFFMTIDKEILKPTNLYRAAQMIAIA